MAAATFTKQSDANGVVYHTLTSTGYFVIPNESPNAVGTIMFQILLNGATLSMTVNGRRRGSAIADADVDSLPYQKIGDATPDKAPTTPITAAGIYYVRSDMLDVVLNITALSVAQPFLYALGGPG